MGRGVTVLGIDVPPELFARWVGWISPHRQPFLVRADSELARLGHEMAPGELPMEAQDTFGVWSLPDGVVCRVLDVDEFQALPRKARAGLVRSQHHLGRWQVPSVRAWPSLRERGTAEQGDGHRFLWWPSLLEGVEREAVIPFVEEGVRPSRHREVPEQVWADCAAMLPAARSMGGTFPSSSGPNCFGTVMGAAGVDGAALTWMQREPFEAWLADVTVPGGRDDEPGTVLVWRSPAGLVQHAAVTLGDGWALHKPSQGWVSPVQVLTVDEVKRASRQPGRRLHRYALRV
ncbi:MAG TPA: hypothetical protein VFR99_04155 [Marmoricola sp.]|nr:hypothetical protein [Marmoricola sp.]